MYVMSPIEMAGTVKLIATPVDFVNLIMWISILGIIGYIILLSSNNA